MLPAVLIVVLAAEPALTRPSVTVVVRGPQEQIAPQALEALGLPLDFKLVGLPNSVALPKVPEASTADAIAQARKSYVNADFERCLKQVDSDAALTASLADGDRSSPARLLLWRVACNVGAAKLEPARRAAREMATYNLEVPAEVGAVSPEVEAVIAQVFRETAAHKPVPLTISSGLALAEVRIDGRATGCTTPCTLDILEGNHVVRLESEGNLPDHRLVRVTAPSSEITLSLSPAPPELAAAQWTARYAQSPDAESAHSMRLLSTALRATRLVLISLDDAGPLKGLLSVDGAVLARSERTELGGLMQDLLVRGQLLEPSAPLWKRPLFWVCIAVAAGIAATTTAVVLSRRVVSEVSFR
jgi:hypothetical protein